MFIITVFITMACMQIGFIIIMFTLLSKQNFIISKAYYTYRYNIPITNIIYYI